MKYIQVDINVKREGIEPAVSALLGVGITDTVVEDPADIEDLLDKKNIDIRQIHQDCGLLIFDSHTQDTHSGGSGCGCAAVVLCAHLLPNILSGKWKRILFVPTGAMLSKVSFNEGTPVAGIAHAVVIEQKQVCFLNGGHTHGLYQCILGRRTDLRSGSDSA